VLDRSEVYKTPKAHEVTLVRPGDLAEVKRSHCVPESGLQVRVHGEPHWCTTYCADCGIEVTDWFVEVWADDATWWFETPGPWFIPVTWLRRIPPTDSAWHAPIQGYAPLEATEAQLRAWNKPS
jgi:hypothetical protein